MSDSSKNDQGSEMKVKGEYMGIEKEMKLQVKWTIGYATTLCQCRRTSLQWPRYIRTARWEQKRVSALPSFE